MARELSVVTMAGERRNAYELREPETLTAAGNGEWIIIPVSVDGRREAAVTLSGTSTWSGSVEATNSPLSQVLDDTAVAFAWPEGVVNTTTNRIIYTATAVRQVNNAGTTTIEVNA